MPRARFLDTATADLFAEPLPPVEEKLFEYEDPLEDLYNDMAEEIGAIPMVNPAIEGMALVRPVLRDYQLEAVRNTLWAISKKNPNCRKSTSVVMATGTGKTVTFSELARRVAEDFGRRVLIVCHQVETVKQWIDTLAAMGIVALREQAGYNAASKLGQVSKVIVVACVKTLVDDRLRSWPSDFFDLTIDDECDLALSPTWSAIRAWFSFARNIGITATPDLPKKRTILEAYERCDADDNHKPFAFKYDIVDAIKQGNLVPAIERRAKHIEIDLSKLKVTFGDFALGGLDDVISSNIGALAEASMQFMGTMPTIAFTPSVFTAQALAEAFNNFGISAVAMSGKTTEEERERIFKLFEMGAYQVICNCSLITRGVDLPCAECLIMARPTTSRSLWVQMVGRVLRPYYNETTGYRKQRATIINFAWKFQKQNHTIPTPIELFTDETTKPEVLMLARAMYDEKLDAADNVEDVDPQEILEAANNQVEEEIRLRLNFTFRKLVVQTTVLDPLSLQILNVQPNPATNIFAGKPVLDWQAENLTRNGWKVEEMPNLDRRGAQDLINEAKRRKDLGLASWRQVNMLIKCGMDYEEAIQCSFSEASAWLNVNLPRQPWYKKQMMFNRMTQERGAQFTDKEKANKALADSNKWRKPKDD